MNEQIASKNWKKNWAGGWSVLSCSYLGYQYTKQLKDVLGISLDEALFISHNGVSACYFTDDDKKAFGIYLAEQAEKDPKIIGDWTQKLIASADRTLTLINDLKKKEISREYFDSFIEAMYDSGVYHRIVKVVVDYLPENILKEYLPVLEKARVHAEPVYEETESYMRYMGEKIAKQNKTRSELVLAMTRSQLLGYFERTKLPTNTVLEEQYKDSALYLVRGNEEAYIGSTIVSEIEASLIKNAKTDQLSGQVAYPGKARGRVRIILEPLPEKTFEEGDILVTGMTRPDYLPYIKKSAGFVTDAGGILSHAAISARELKKPCLIGTETGTKMLKDGDMVEIDADKGVIKILERSGE